MAKTQKKKKSGDAGASRARRVSQDKTRKKKGGPERNDLDKIIWDRIGPLTVDVK